MKNFIEQATKRLGKKRMRMVEEIHVDSEVYEVVLYPGYHNTHYGGETMWVFGQHHLKENGGDQTVNKMFDDLIWWFSEVEKETQT